MTPNSMLDECENIKSFRYKLSKILNERKNKFLLKLFSFFYCIPEEIENKEKFVSLCLFSIERRILSQQTAYKVSILNLRKD